ncbi:MAG TPA: hypothetical protein VHI77_05650 [Solirubrobacterales bacterium]|nr:hypothetical protein [Solirubrobacterales bacterium]
MKGRPDVDVSTRVRAKELRFGRVPETRVWFEGEPAQESTSVVERKGLPDEVEPEVTYRDIEVRWSAGARIVHPTDAEGAEPP